MTVVFGLMTIIQLSKSLLHLIRQKIATTIRPTQHRLKFIRLPDLEEIKQALFSVDSNKTLTPDGFGVGFFKRHWNIVGHDFSKYILETFRNGKLLKEINIHSSHSFPKLRTHLG